MSRENGSGKANRMRKFIAIAGRRIGDDCEPFVIAEAGINHDGDMRKAIKLVDAAQRAGADCVKFQCHIVPAEMIPNDVKPENASGRSIWDVIKKSEFSEDEEVRIKKYCDKKGILYLSTPFSKEAADRLLYMGVPAFKIGSGECNNTPLIEHIARMKKPMILSTGMNDIGSIKKTVSIIKRYGCPLALTHCTSMYPTPFNAVRLGAMESLRKVFQVPVGLSDHSEGVYASLAAVALGACIIEKHFTVDRRWSGPDNPMSIEPDELAYLVKGARAIFAARGGAKDILPEEMPVIKFAYASVVSLRDIERGEEFSKENIWVKRPGTGEILAHDFHSVLGKFARVSIKKDRQITRSMIDG